MGVSQVRQHVITIAMMTLMLYSACELAGIFFGSYRDQAVMAEAQHMYESSGENMASEEVPIASGWDEREPSVRSRFHSLLEQNPDIVGWVEIADTPINYPVVQAEDNSFYLSHNYRRVPSRSGSIFMDFRNDPGQDNRNMILYGHRMKDGSMFGSLGEYLDEDFYQTHRTFSFETKYHRYDVEVFSVYVTTVDFDYIKTDFASDQEYRSFVEEIAGRSIYQVDTDLADIDQIVTLSTCDYSLNSNLGRLVVHATIKNSGTK